MQSGCLIGWKWCPVVQSRYWHQYRGLMWRGESKWSYRCQWDFMWLVSKAQPLSALLSTKVIWLADMEHGCAGRDMCLQPVQNGRKCHKAPKYSEFNCVVALTASIRRSDMSHWSGDGLLVSLSLVWRSLDNNLNWENRNAATHLCNNTTLCASSHLSK